MSGGRSQRVSGVRALAGCLATFVGTAAFAATLAVSIENIRENKGKLRLTIYEAKNWLDENPASTAGARDFDLSERKGDEPVVLRLELASGEYGAVIYHDLNANVKLDRNLIGIPKEPYAFSQGFDKMRRPAFEDCKFVVGGDRTAITLTFPD